MLEKIERGITSLYFFKFFSLNNNQLPFQLGIDPLTGKYGYYKRGADTLTPFNAGGSSFESIIFYDHQTRHGARIEDGEIVEVTSMPDLGEGSSVFRCNLVPGEGGRLSSRVVTLKNGYYTYRACSTFHMPEYHSIGDEIYPYLVGPYGGDVYGFTIVYFGEENPFE